LQKKTMPKVTVYITNYNYARFLDQAIRSVFSQTTDDWELIIIDDGSTDGTKDVLSRYRGHPKIRIIEQENKGLSVSNNIALRLANGKYLVRLDADDFLDENMLLVLANTLDKKPGAGLVYPDYYHVDENGNIIEIIRRKKIGQEVELLDLPAHGACTMFRKECLMEIGGYQEDFSCQDGYDIWLRMIARYEPCNVSVPLFYYRRHAKSLTTDEARILKTRGRIKRRFVDENKNGERPRVLGVVPVVRRSVYPQAEPFTDLAGKPLLWYTLEQLGRTNVLERVILAADDDEVVAYGKKFPGIETFKRPMELSGGTIRMKDVIKYILDNLKKSSGYEPDAVCILYVNTPLRKARHIEKAIDTMSIFDVDSIISVEEELNYCYQHGRMGLASVRKSRRNVRVEREAIYKENGAIYLTRAEVIHKGRLLGERIGHITMEPHESIKITSELSLWMTEKIILEWNKKRENTQAD